MEEVFEKLASHMIKGLMTHDSLANYYDFLGLRGYKRCHEYHFYKESIAYRKLQRYYINCHSKLIPEQEIEEPVIIPDSWTRHKREEVNVSEKRSAVESGVKAWVSWEQETKALLEDSIKKLYENGYIADADYLKRYLADVTRELKYAERKALDLSAVNYDIIYIMEEQAELHDKYKDKTKSLMC